MKTVDLWKPGYGCWGKTKKQGTTELCTAYLIYSGLLPVGLKNKACQLLHWRRLSE
jgi:hypothetical protein